jgi:hypothetical protein
MKKYSRRWVMDIPKDENGRFIFKCDDDFSKFVMRYRSEDKDLSDMASEFQEKYFSDFTLRAFKKDMQKIELKKDGKWVTVLSDPMRDLYGNPDLFDQGTRWIFRYCEKFENSKTLGTSNYVDREILIHKKCKRDKKKLMHVLLHEMIHAYEDDFFDASKVTNPMMQYLCFMRRDYLMIKLMQKLKMNKRVLSNALNEAAAHGIGNIAHTPFFALKAMELDRRLKLKLGTITGYGKEKYY